jgi:S-phase kinase-associated protein 1
MSSVTIECGDGKKVTCAPEAARLSGLMSAMLPDDGTLAEPIPLADRPECASVVVTKVVAFMTLAAAQPSSSVEIAMPLKGSGTLAESQCPSWATDFIDGIKGSDGAADWPLIFDMLKLADYMDVRGLVTLCAAKIASRYRAMSDAQRAAVFRPSRPFSQEEEQAVRSRNAWAETDAELERELASESASSGAAASSR